MDYNQTEFYKLQRQFQIAMKALQTIAYESLYGDPKIEALYALDQIEDMTYKDEDNVISLPLKQK